MSVIRTISGVFTAIDVPVTMVLPVDAIEVALRVKTNPPSDINPEIDLTFVDSGGPSGPTFTRTFVLNPDGEVLPATFVKYIGTIPFGPAKQIVHMVEVATPVLARSA